MQNLLYRELSVSRTLTLSYVAETLQLYRYRHVLEVFQNFSARGVRGEGGEGPPNVNLGPPPIISETILELES